MPFGPRLVFANRWLFGPLIERQVLNSREGAAMLRTTTAATIFNAGTKSNVLPTRASASVNFRIVPGETPETVAARVREVIDDERVTVTIVSGTAPSAVSNPESAAYRLIERTIRQVIPADPIIVSPYLVIGGTDARHYAHRSDVVFRFLPMVFEEGDLERMHGTNERLSIEGLANGIRFFRQLIVNLDELS